MNVYQVDYDGRKHRLEVPDASAINHDCWDGESPIGKGQKRCYWHGKRLEAKQILGYARADTKSDYAKAKRALTRV